MPTDPLSINPQPLRPGPVGTPGISEASIIEQALPAARASLARQQAPDKTSHDNQADNSFDEQPDASEHQLSSSVKPVATSGGEAHAATGKLQHEANQAEKHLEKTEKDVSEAEKTLQKESSGGHHGPTVAGYPLSELAKAFVRPPQPVGESSEDPELEIKQNEIDQTKQHVIEAKKETSKIKQKAEKFQKQEQKSLQHLDDLTSNLD